MNRYKNQIKGKKPYGLGARRIVYDQGNGYVLKIPIGKDGLISNEREVKIYRLSPLHLKKYLRKIKEYGQGYRWLTIKKYSRHFPISIKYAQILQKLKKIFKKGGIIPWEIVSRYNKPNYQNLRLKKNGEIVVIDYGNFRFSRKKSMSKDPTESLAHSSNDHESNEVENRLLNQILVGRTIQ
jgi:hypothetical protein